jgi:hypothetical protein
LFKTLRCSRGIRHSSKYWQAAFISKRLISIGASMI